MICVNKVQQTHNPSSLRGKLAQWLLGSLTGWLCAAILPAMVSRLWHPPLGVPAAASRAAFLLPGPRGMCVARPPRTQVAAQRHPGPVLPITAQGWNHLVTPLGPHAACPEEDGGKVLHVASRALPKLEVSKVAKCFLPRHGQGPGCPQ